jgi:TM2 domain-containing membrane protein YozV
MNCATHPQAPATAFCRTCGKALCEECKRDVRGVIYCEDCIVARLGDAQPAAGASAPAAPAAAPDAYREPVPGAPNPALAAVLAGFFPFGIGQVYNGQIGKAVAHLVTFAMLIVMIDNAGDGAEPFFGIAIAFFYFYQIFDAYRTAKAKQLGLPLPDPGGIYKSLGVQLDGGSAAPAAGGPSVPAAPRIPTAAVVLIGLGFLFLLHNMGLFHLYWVGRLWPLILIFIGVRLFMRNRPSGS